MFREYISEYCFGWIRDPLFKFTPEAGLPRRWRFYADPGFWLIPVILLPFVLIFRLWQYVVWMFGFLLGLHVAPAGELWIAVTVVCVLAFHPLLCLWVAWDSYRWNFPGRVPYIVWICLTSVMVFMVYLIARSTWVMEAQRQARMHKLGLHDE